jgi:branched-chain amino acid transport system ATP-binding protein
MLEISHIDVYYGDLQALWDVSLTIGDGEIVTLVGSNGAGKSTLMKTISGLLKVRDGHIDFDSIHLDRVPAHRIVELGISMVPEGRRIFPQMSVLENLEMGASINTARKVRQNTLNGIYDLFPILKERAKQMAGTLSGGEQQMLAIGRALMARPNLLLLDEPSLGLAPIVIKLLFDTIRVLNMDGVTILLVEQNVRKTLEIADYVFVLKMGVMTMEGQPDQLLTNPEFRRAFLGRIG